MSSSKVIWAGMVVNSIIVALFVGFGLWAASIPGAFITLSLLVDYAIVKAKEEWDV